MPRHELIGGIAIMLEQDPAAAEQLLSLRPSLHTVLFPLSDVEGEFRTRRFEVLAGIPVTKTLCVEYGHRFEIDLSEAYFSARLATERQRIAGMMGKGEQVLDMFAGVGPFAIVLADKAGQVLATDINPEVLDEKVLSAIVEFMIPAERLPQILEVLDRVSQGIDTVFSGDIIARVGEDGSVPYANEIRKRDRFLSINGKSNVGLGRPLAAV
jgi:hypothetical protein